MLKMVQRTDESILVMFWIARGTVTFDCPQIKGKKGFDNEATYYYDCLFRQFHWYKFQYVGEQAAWQRSVPCECVGLMLVSFQIKALHWQPPSVSTNRGAAVFVAPARD